MERKILADLLEWSSSEHRMPLIVRGARQVGKTWALQELGRQRYENTVHIDLERQRELHELFHTTRDPKRLVALLSVVVGEPINPQSTLLILDEIQECPDALTALKYFQEDAPEYHVASAGSLLGLALAKPSSYPVGKVDLLDMRPMTFSEFLMATGNAGLASYLHAIDALEPLPQALHEPLCEQLRLYLAVGGMPAAVHVWAEQGDIAQVQKTLSNLLVLYELDFHKHAQGVDPAKIDLVWESIPSQLARENKKFLYKLVRTGARAREYESAVQWLVHAQALTRVTRSKRPGIPMSAYDERDAFKLYMNDVGMLRQHAGLDPGSLMQGDGLFVEFKGALAENYVLQSLVAQLDRERAPRYWAMDNPRYEVDFLIQHHNDVLPVEVKAGENVKSPSLRRYRKEFADATPLALRFSLRNLSFDGGVLNVPLYLADEALRLVDVALGQGA